MIAPIRQTESSPYNEQKELLARARRAVAKGLLSRQIPSPSQPSVARWAAWAFTIWTAFVAASVVFTSWYWSFKPY